MSDKCSKVLEEFPGEIWILEMDIFYQNNQNNIFTKYTGFLNCTWHLPDNNHIKVGGGGGCPMAHNVCVGYISLHKVVYLVVRL